MNTIVASRLLHSRVEESIISWVTGRRLLQSRLAGRPYTSQNVTCCKNVGSSSSSSSGSSSIVVATDNLCGVVALHGGRIYGEYTSTPCGIIASQCHFFLAVIYRCAYPGMRVRVNPAAVSTQDTRENYLVKRTSNPITRRTSYALRAACKDEYRPSN